MLSPFLDAQVTGIAEHLLLITVQQFIGGYDVVDVGGRSVDAVNQPECVVDTDVHLHAEVPLVTLPGLVHFWRSADAVTLAALILGGARCRNDAFIHDAAFAQHQAILLQVLVHLFEQHLAKAVALHEMTKLEDGGFVRQTIHLQTSEAPHGFDLVKRIFHRRITEVVKELHAVNPQHGRQRVRWPAVLALGVVMSHLLLHLVPRNQLVHPFQKDLAACLALLVLVLGFGEGYLAHGGGESYAVSGSCIIADFGKLFRGSLGVSCKKWSGKLAYIKKHWRGELSLAISFWVNVFLVNIGIRVFEAWLTEASPIENPVAASQVTIAYLFVALVLIHPWQIVGLWRSANKHAESTKKRLWSGVVKVVVVFGLLGTLGNVNLSWPIYRDLYQIGFGADEYGDYIVELTGDNQRIHLKGGLGFGIAKEVAQLVAENPNVNGIILDSIGGRIYEGRELSKIIFINGLDTYSLKGCYSACGTAFISGNKRYLAKGANLAFHQYKSGFKSFDSFVDMPSEQKKDLALYQKRDINQDFIDRIFKAKQDDLWYPTIEEMLTSGVVHKIVNPSTVKPINYDSFKASELEDALKDISAFQTIKKYEPKTYQQIIKGMEAQMKKGASIIEIQQGVGAYIQLLAGKALPKTSNKALIMFAGETINVLKKLENMEPILCMKNLSPEQYGSLEMTEYFTNDEMMPMLNALSLVIADSYNTDNSITDVAAAEKLVTEIVIQLGDDASYLETTGLQNREEYSKACKTVIRFYEEILLNSNKTAGNGLRYVFSP